MKQIMDNKNFMNPERKTRLLLLAALFMSSLFIFWRYLFGNELMVFNDVGGDTLQLYVMQYTSVVNHIREGSFSWWDMTHGFGVNYFKLEPFDPAFLLTVGAGVILGPDKMLFVLSWVQVLKVLAAGYIFYHYLSCFSFGRQAKLAAAFAYGLNGYLLVWGQHYQFGTAVVYFPLLLLGCEKYIQNRKGKVIFPLAVFLTGIYSAYFSYMCLAALGLYLLFRIVMEEGKKWKERILKFLGGCWRIILGLGMSMGIFLPLSEFLLNVSSRVGTGDRGLLESIKRFLTFYPEKFYESVLMRLFSSNLQMTFAKKDEWFEAYFNYYEDPIFFCSTLAVLLNVAFLFVFWKSGAAKRTKAAVYSGAVLIVLCVTVELGGFVFNGFSDITNRYTFVLIPFFLLSFAWMWDYIKEQGKIPLLLIFGFSVVMIFVYAVGYKQSLFPEHKLNAFILCATGLCMAVCVVCCVKGGRYKNSAMTVLLVLLFINVTSDGRACYEERICVRKSDTPAEEIAAKQAVYEEERNSKDPLRVEKAERTIPQGFFGALYNPNIQDALKWLEEHEQGFYRLEKDFISGTWCMDAQVQGYYGVSSYNSVLNQNLKEFIDTCCPELYAMDHNHYSFTDCVEDNKLAAFFGIRYLLSRDGNLDSSKYEKLEQFGDIYLYKNTEPAFTAKFFSDAISEESFKKLYSKESRDVLLENVIAAEGGTDIADISEVKKMGKQGTGVVLQGIISDESHIEGQAVCTSDGYVMFMIPYEKGWHLTVDGKEQALFRGDLGFAACSMKEGVHNYSLTFIVPGMKEGMAISAVFWCIFLLGEIYAYIRKRYSGNRV